MKGDKKLIDKLNQLLMEELTAVNQYFVHSEMVENWGYSKLKASVKARAITEMKHAEKLIERILFLEGTPIVSELGPVNIGADVTGQLKNDLAAEHTAVAHYNDGIKLAQEVADNATKELLDAILKDEDSHVDDLESRHDLIAQMGLQNYLPTQM